MSGYTFRYYFIKQASVNISKKSFRIGEINAVFVILKPDPYDARLRQFPDYDVDAGNWVITIITASAEHRTWRRANDVTNDVTSLQQRHHSIRDCDVT